MAIHELIASQTAAVSVSDDTALRTIPGCPVVVSAVGLATTEEVDVYKWDGAAYQVLTYGGNGATAGAVKLTATATDIVLQGGPLYAFAKDETAGAAKVIAHV